MNKLFLIAAAAAISLSAVPHGFAQGLRVGSGATVVTNGTAGSQSAVGNGAGANAQASVAGFNSTGPISIGPNAVVGLKGSVGTQTATATSHAVAQSTVAGANSTSGISIGRSATVLLSGHGHSQASSANGAWDPGQANIGGFNSD